MHPGPAGAAEESGALGEESAAPGGPLALHFLTPSTPLCSGSGNNKVYCVLLDSRTNVSKPKHHQELLMDLMNIKHDKMFEKETFTDPSETKELKSNKKIKGSVEKLFFFSEQCL